MADKQIEIELVSKADISGAEELKDKIDELKQSAEEGINLTDNAPEISQDMDNLGTSAEEASSSVDNLNNSTGSMDGSNVQGVGSDFTTLGGEADSADQEIQELQGSLDLLEAGALMGISSELSNLGSKAEGLAQDMNTASISVGQLATQTGVAEPQMVSLINHISNATFPNDEAMMYVKSLDQIGVSANNLGQSATDLDKINDAFGLGANKVNSLGQELSVLGVDMNNVSSAFNALAYANANTVGGMDNYYTFLRKYDAQFKELGFNVDQASVIIAAATQKFGGGRAALSGLNDALEESNGDTRALEQALGLEAGALENASQLTGQYEGQLQTLADEEAAHKTWLDQLNAAWEDLSLSLSPVLAPLTSFIGLIGQVGSFATGINSLITLTRTFREMEIVSSITGKLSGLRTALTTVATSARTALVNIAGFSRTLLTTAATAIKNAIVGLAQLAKNVLLTGYNALKSAAMWAIEKGAMIASTIAEYATTAAQWALNVAMSANPIGILIIAIVALIAILGYLYFNNEQVRAAIDGLGQTFMMVGQIIYNSLVNAVNIVITTLQGLWNYIVTLGGLLPQSVNITGNQIIDGILAVMMFIATLPAQLAMIFVNIIAQALGFGNNFTQTLINGAINAVSGFIGRIQSGVSQFTSAINGIRTALQSCLDWAYNMVMSHPLVQALQWLGSQAASAFSILGLGQGSPGKIYHALENELNWSENMVDKSSLPDTTAKLGKNMADNFSPDFSFDSNVNGFANGSIDKVLRVMSAEQHGDIIINIEGDVDSDRRVNQIIEVIRRELNWDNTTAGRTI
ncbi:hypothetical protein [Methanobrevibacter sp.]|uniref:phage tail protein n=1 Tax=Methanobrevibacter sp. TaxID=66852 RepID=UPI0038907C55